MGDKAKNAVKVKKYGNSMQYITTRIIIYIKSSHSYTSNV